MNESINESETMHDFNQLAALCLDRHIYIQTHNFPDPDAIASVFGLQRLLALCGIPSTLCYDGRIDKLSASKMLEAFQIEMFPYEQLRPNMTEDDYVICVDAQKHSGNITDFVGNEVACIDHHPTFVPMEYHYKDIRLAGACATLIAQYYQQLSCKPDKDTATALLYGLKMDTLQFTRGVTELDIEMFAFLFPLCDQETLVRLERNNMEFSDLKAYGAAIESIELYNKVGLSYLPLSGCPDCNDLRFHPGVTGGRGSRRIFPQGGRHQILRPLRGSGHPCGLSGSGCASWIRRWRRTRRNGGRDDPIGKRTSAGTLSQRYHP